MSLFDKVKAIAHANKDGFTISLLDLQKQKKGFCVAMKQTQNSFNDDGLKKVLETAQQSTNIIGGWYNSRNKKYYYDCVVIVSDLQTAKELGKANEQIAIFDLEKEQEIEI